MPKLSVVIPAYNSAETLYELVFELKKAIGSTTAIDAYELIFVNDASKDNTLEVLCKIAEDDPFVKVIGLARNFGQHNALMAGLRRATGDYILCADDDLQTDPAFIPAMLDKLLEGNYDVLYAQYDHKKHNVFRNLGSKLNDFMAHHMLREPKGVTATSFFVMKKFVNDEIIKYDRPYPYLSGLVYRTTQNIGTLPVQHRARQVGKSNYTLRRLISLWSNAFTNFSILPLRVISLVGCIFAFLSAIAIIWIFIHNLLDPNVTVGWTSLMMVTLFIGGLLMVGIGLVGEYIGRIYMCINRAPQYVEKTLVNFAPKEEPSDGTKS